MVKTTTPPLDMSAVVDSAAPVVEKKPKKKSAKAEKEAAAAVTETVAELTALVAQAGAVTVPSVEVSVSDRSDLSADLNDEIADLLKNLQSRSALDNAIKINAKSIEKKVAKITKLMEKTTKKRKSSQNKVSGFEKPTAISDELAKFVGEPVGTMLARTAVSKKIHEYVKSNNLQNPNNRRIIIPDAKLKKLLKTSGTDELSYFNLQKFLKVHFKKDAKV
jgi:chromatin remodeling complex protein RSC6